MKAISERFEALRTTMSSSMSKVGAPATYAVPMGPIRNTLQNAACLTTSTPQATFDTLFRRLQSYEKIAEPIPGTLEDEVAKQNAMTSASLRLLYRQGLDGYRAIGENSDMLKSIAVSLGKRLEESKSTCLLKTNAAATSLTGADVPTYRPDDTTPFGGVSVDFDAVERERLELVQLLNLK